jgi:uncharacterized lipoprotein YbaY
MGHAERRVASSSASVLAAFLVLVASAGTPVRAARLAVLRGTVTLSDEGAIPRDSLLRVHLHDLSPGISRKATVASETFEIEGKAPIPFELHYNETTIEPDRLYGVAAEIMDLRGRTLWETRVAVRVLTLGNQKKVQLLLRPSDRTEPPPDPTAYAIECDGLSFDVRLDDTSATILLPGSKIVLPRTETSFGKRFSDGASTLSISGSAAYFQGEAHAYRNCKARPSGESRAGGR